MFKRLNFGGLPCFLLVSLVAASLLAQFAIRASASSPVWQEYIYSGPAGSRPYFVYTPLDYQVGTSVPLVVMLHGCTQSAASFAAGTHMNQLADEHNFIVVYPQQVSAASQNLCWNWFNPANQVRGSGEPAIITGIVQAIKEKVSQWTIDARRIYVVGFSAGAAMAAILGATYPDIFAAIGVHSGMEYQAATNQLNALKAMRRGGPSPLLQGQAAFDAMGSLARTMPTIVFQGANDYVVKPVNGDQVVQQWMMTDFLTSNNTYNPDFGSPNSTTPGKVPRGRSYTVYTWADSHRHELQEYWKVRGMGHAWSGGNTNGSFTDPLGPDASQAMYTFFINHPMGAGEAQGARFWVNLRQIGARFFKRLFNSSRPYVLSLPQQLI